MEKYSSALGIHRTPVGIVPDLPGTDGGILRGGKGGEREAKAGNRGGEEVVAVIHRSSPGFFP